MKFFALVATVAALEFEQPCSEELCNAGAEITGDENARMVCGYTKMTSDTLDAAGDAAADATGTTDAVPAVENKGIRGCILQSLCGTAATDGDGSINYTCGASTLAAAATLLAVASQI